MVVVHPAQLAAQNLGEGSQPLYGTLWSYVNGMESGAVLCVFGLLAYVFVKRPYLDSDLNALVYGALLALLTLARLDHVFFSAVFALAVALRLLLRPSRTVVRRALLTLGCFALPVALYMLINKIYFGSAIPLSGQLKSTYPLLSNDFIHLLKNLERHRRSGKWLALGWRVTQLLVPLLVAVIYLPRSFKLQAASAGVTLAWRYPERRMERLLGLTAIGVLLLGAYNFLFVGPGHQGHWYYPLSTLFVSLALIQVVGRFRWSLKLERNAGLIACGLVIALASAWFFARLHVTPDYHRRYAVFFLEEAPRIRAHYRSRPTPKLFSVDDGIVAFSTGFPTMSGTGLNTDARGLLYRKARRLGELAVARGYTHFTSFNYVNINPGRLPRRANSSRIAALIRRGYQIKHPKRYVFSVDYRSPKLTFAIIRVRRKRPSGRRPN